METIQNVGMRIILNALRMATGTEMRQKLRWCALAQRRKLHSLKLAHRCLHNVGPTYLHHKFRYMSDVSGICTRGSHNSKLYLNSPRINRSLSKILQILNWKVVELSSFFTNALYMYFEFILNICTWPCCFCLLLLCCLLFCRCTYAGLT